MGPTSHHLLPPSSSSQPASAPLHSSPAALCALSPGVTRRSAGRTAGARGGGRRRGASGVHAALSLSLCAPKSDRAAVFLSSAAPPPSLTGCGTSASRRPLPPDRSLAGARPLQPAGPSSAAAEEGRCGRFDLPHRRFWSVELAEKASRVHGGREGARGTGGRAREGIASGGGPA